MTKKNSQKTQAAHRPQATPILEENRFQALSISNDCNLDSEEMNDISTARDLPPRPPMQELPMSMRLKIDIEHKEKEPTYPDFLNPYTHKSFFLHSGPVVRIFNSNVPGVPQEVAVLRLTIRNPKNIPAFVYLNRETIKNWALDQIYPVVRENGYNTFADSRLSPSEFTLRWTISSLSQKGKEQFGPQGEVALWACFCPEFLAPQVVETYSDGSREQFLILNAYVNLVPVQSRIRQPPEGWNVRQVTDERRKEAVSTDGRPAEKKPRNNFRNDYREWVELGAENERKLREKELEIENLKKEAMRKLAPVPMPNHYPNISPASARSYGGPTPWVNPDKDIPKFVY